MASEELLKYIKDAERLVEHSGYSPELAVPFYEAGRSAIGSENDVGTGLYAFAKAKECLEKFTEQKMNGTIWQLDAFCSDHKEMHPVLEKYYNVLQDEAYYKLDSYCIYVEKDRPRAERFYLPRRKTLIRVVDKLQMLEEDKLDELFLHMPARTGKSQTMTMYAAWHCCRDPEHSNLYCTYKESLGGAFLEGMTEILTDPTYCHVDVFPGVPIVYTDAKNHKIDLKRRKKYKTISGKGLESGLNGEYDAYGVMIIDDILEGIQDVLNTDTLHRKQIVFDNNLMSRKKEKCKVIYNGTIWSLHDIFMNRRAFLESNPEAADIRWAELKLPALDPITDESNFDYDYGVGYSTAYYRKTRAKFEENDDMAGWLAQYQQEPIERDGAVFNPEHMHFYNGVLPAEEPLKIVAACDVALGGHDYLSMPIAYCYEDGSVYIDDVVFDNAEKNITQPEVIHKIIEHNVGSAFFESNQGGEGYKDDIDRQLKLHKDFNGGKGINITSAYAPTSMRKEQRIWDKAESIRTCYFRDPSCQDAQYRKFMTNLYSFTINGKNKFDDGPDSMATLIDFIENGSGRKVSRIRRSPF